MFVVITFLLALPLICIPMVGTPKYGEVASLVLIPLS